MRPAAGSARCRPDTGCPAAAQHAAGAHGQAGSQKTGRPRDGAVRARESIRCRRALGLARGRERAQANTLLLTVPASSVARPPAPVEVPPAACRRVNPLNSINILGRVGCSYFRSRVPCVVNFGLGGCARPSSSKNIPSQRAGRGVCARPPPRDCRLRRRPSSGTGG